eukprot:gene45675-64696_t
MGGVMSTGHVFFAPFDYESHSEQMPTQHFVSCCLAAVTVLGLAWSVFAKAALAQPRESEWALRSLLRGFGVQLRRGGDSARIERKAFHLCGLLVPIIYRLLLHAHHTHHTHQLLLHAPYADDRIIVGIRATRRGARRARRWRQRAVRDGAHRAAQRGGRRMRRRAPTAILPFSVLLTGGCYFALGCSLAICLFPAPVAITSILFLVLGDMSAAIIGVSFGGEACVVKLGREGKKSAEGSLAMLVVCFVVGCIFFSQVHLVLLGAVAATLTELYEPFDINDNLSIPVVTCLALSFGLHRIEGCGGIVPPG